MLGRGPRNTGKAVYVRDPESEQARALKLDIMADEEESKDPAEPEFNLMKPHISQKRKACKKYNADNFDF